MLWIKERSYERIRMLILYSSFNLSFVNHNQTYLKYFIKFLKIDQHFFVLTKNICFIWENCVLKLCALSQSLSAYHHRNRVLTETLDFRVNCVPTPGVRRVSTIHKYEIYISWFQWWIYRERCWEYLKTSNFKQLKYNINNVI